MLDLLLMPNTTCCIHAVRAQSLYRPGIDLPHEGRRLMAHILKAGTNCGFKKRETKDLVISGHDQTI